MRAIKAATGPALSLLLSVGCSGSDSKQQPPDLNAGGSGATNSNGTGGSKHGGGASSGGSGSGYDSSAGAPSAPGDGDTGCAGRLRPVEHTGDIQVVGDGTADSCSADALEAAMDALNDTEAGGTLTFDCGGEHTIELEQTLYVAQPLVIDGNGEITLSGGAKTRVIELDNYVDLVLQRLTIRDGFVPAGSENESGAGLLHPWFGTLKVIDVTFQNNHSESDDHDVGGGAIYAGGLTEAIISGCTFVGNSGSTGGAVLSRSTNLRVIDSVFKENSATTYGEDGQYGNGGGLYIDRMWLDDPIDFVLCGALFENNHAKVHGSAFFSYNLEGSGARFDRSTFRGNDMQDSPGGGTGTVYHEGVPLTLVGCTFSDNATGAHAGGIFLGGGTDAQVENCTFANNETPGNAGALWAGNGTVDVTNTTFHENSADYGPAIFKGQSGKVTLTNVIFSNNTTANEYSAVACHETFGDGGGNVQWPDVKNNGNADTPCAQGILFADPGLLPLADNGGPTETMALPEESPAIDVGSDCPERDQRGEPRVGDCDSGAFEYPP
ncbi:MAG: right-handed parallel beta-helix repeat-containing protein [Polyangiaceae bacterium]|nr:right-handed parallel beta-helix repeat-containing protein [Polyangiaceae bacterium]